MPWIGHYFTFADMAPDPASAYHRQVNPHGNSWLSNTPQPTASAGPALVGTGMSPMVSGRQERTSDHAFTRKFGLYCRVRKSGSTASLGAIGQPKAQIIHVLLGDRVFRPDSLAGCCHPLIARSPGCWLAGGVDYRLTAGVWGHWGQSAGLYVRRTWRSGPIGASSWGSMTTASPYRRR